MAGLYVAHVGLIFAVYMTFKQFHKAERKSNSVFETKNFDPFKIMVIVFVVVFIFVFSKGIEILTSPNPNSFLARLDVVFLHSFDGYFERFFERFHFVFCIV